MAIVFRVDANARIGLGHLTRCLALADILRFQFDCIFAVQEPATEVQQQINAVTDKILIIPSDNPEDYFLKRLDAYDVVVLDGYHFDESFQRKIKEKGCGLVFIDDLNAHHFVADVVINHSLNANAAVYATEDYTKVYAGAGFALLRSAFYMANIDNRSNNTFNKVLVCMGGSDFQNHSLSLTRVFCGYPGITKVNVLVGSAYGHDIEALKICDKVQVFQNLDAVEMIGLMKQSDFGAISASGVANECAAVGLPFIVGYYANNQVNFYNALVKQPNISGIGCLRDANPGVVLAALDVLKATYDPVAPSFIDKKQVERYREIFSIFADKAAPANRS